MDRIEAAARALCKHDGEDPDMMCFDGTPCRPKNEPLWLAGGYDAAARAAIAAADAVSVSDDDAALLDKFSTYADGWKETLTARGEEVPPDVSEIGRLVELARRGAVVSVVPEPWGWACWWA